MQCCIVTDDVLSLGILSACQCRPSQHGEKCLLCFLCSVKFFHVVVYFPWTRSASSLLVSSVCSLRVSVAVQLCPWLWLLRMTFLIILLPSLGLRFLGKANSQFPWIIWLHYFHCQGSVRFFCCLVQSLQNEWYMGFSCLMTDNLDKAPLFYCLSH